MAKKFTATIGSKDRPLFVEVPFDVKEIFGKARLPVRVTINGHVYRTTIAVYSGKYFVPVNKEHRNLAGVTAGETVEVMLEPDLRQRIVEVPPELKGPFAKRARLKAAWKDLSYSPQREHVGAILSAKKPETRLRRIEKTIQVLEKNK